MRLIFLTNCIPPYHKPVLDVLRERYRDFRVLLSTPRESNRQWNIDWEGLDVVVQKTLTLKGRWRHPRGFSEPVEVHLPVDTISQLSRFKADVIISTELGMRTLFAVLYTKIHRRAKVIIWTEVTRVTEEGRGRSRQLLRRFLVRHAHAFLALGTEGTRYIESLGADRNLIYKLKYTTDVERFARNQVQRPPHTRRRLLYVGQLIERKGLHRFIGHLSDWARANPNRTVQLSIAGHGPLRPTLEALPVPSNLNLQFLGNVNYEELPRVYEQADVFVFPTLADTWGLVVNEAMASGLPVLGSEYSQAVQELISDGKSGWVFRSDDSDAARAAIDRCLNTPFETLKSMGELARAAALELAPPYVAHLIETAVSACFEQSEPESTASRNPAVS